MSGVEDLINAQTELSEKTRNCEKDKFPTGKAISLEFTDLKTPYKSQFCTIDAIESVGQNLANSTDAKAASAGRAIQTYGALLKVNHESALSLGASLETIIKSKYPQGKIASFFKLFMGATEHAELVENRGKTFTKASVMIIETAAKVESEIQTTLIKKEYEK